MSRDNFVEYPQNIYSPRTILGEYRGWEISIGVTRGDDYDILSVSATNKDGNSFCRSYGKSALCGGTIPSPSDLETKKEVDGLKRSVDDFENRKKTVVILS